MGTKKERNMITIGIYSHKGGTGKTTCSLNVATLLANEFGKKILFVDMDDQGDSTEFLLDAYGEYETSEGYYNEYFRKEIGQAEGMEGKYYEIDPLIKKALLTYKDGSFRNLDIDVIPSCPQIDLYPFEADFVTKLISPFKNDYDFCIIDMPPRSNQIVYSSLAACDYCIYMSRPDGACLSHWAEYNDTIQQIRNLGWNSTLQSLGICLNEVEDFKGMKELMNLLTSDEIIADYVMDTKIPHSGTISTSNTFHCPLTFYRPNSSATKVYRKLVREILKKIGVK